MSETARPIAASGATGSICPSTGPYRSSRNAHVIIFLKRGDKFPVDADGAKTTWTLAGA
jgi:hypothetical protein